MADLPIPFSAPMVRALLEGRKTQTRRILGKRTSVRRPNIFDGTWTDDYVLDPGNASWRERDIPYAVGDRLYVREHWRCPARYDDTAPRDLTPRGTTIFYECGGSASTEIPAGIMEGGVSRGPETGERWIVSDDPDPGSLPPYVGRFRQGMHMPRWASRLTLTVTEVRVQRLQDISEEDAVAEGVHATRITEVSTLTIPSFVASFRGIWNRLHGPEAWDQNPWVAAYSFTVQHGNIDTIKESNS